MILTIIYDDLINFCNERMRHIPIIKLEDVENDIATHQLIFKIKCSIQ